MKKKPKTKDKDRVVPTTPSAPMFTFISIRNNLNQAVHLNIKDVNGKMIGIQLDANASRRWPKLPDYGPDTARLLSRKVIRLEPVDA